MKFHKLRTNFQIKHLLLSCPSQGFAPDLWQLGIKGLDAGCYPRQISGTSCSCNNREVSE